LLSKRRRRTRKLVQTVVEEEHVTDEEEKGVVKILPLDSIAQAASPAPHNSHTHVCPARWRRRMP